MSIAQHITEQNANIRLINFLEELGFTNFHEKLDDNLVALYTAEKAFPCRIDACNVSLKLIIEFAYDFIKKIPVFMFSIKHHEGEKLDKGIDFESNKIIVYKQEHRGLDVFEKATEYVMDNIYKFAYFTKLSPEEEREKVLQKWGGDEEIAESYFYVTPRFKDGEILFKTCEIDVIERHTEFYLKKEDGYHGFILQRW